MGAMKTERIYVRVSETEGNRSRWVAKMLQRSRADAIRFLLDREYRVLKGLDAPSSKVQP